MTIVQVAALHTWLHYTGDCITEVTIRQGLTVSFEKVPGEPSVPWTDPTVL